MQDQKQKTEEYSPGQKEINKDRELNFSNIS